MRKSLAFVLLAFGWSWGFFVLAILASQNRIGLTTGTVWPIVVGAFGPSIAAAVLTTKFEGWKSLKKMLLHGFSFRFPLTEYLFIVLVPLSIAAVGSFLSGDFVIQIAKTLPLVGIVIFFLGGSFGEEFGWRGFLLPTLLARHRPLFVTMLLAAVWAVWHLPLFWVPSTSQYVTPFWLYAIYITALSVQYVWLYFRTHGNLSACLLLHTFTNLTVIVFPLPSDQTTSNFRFTVEVALNLLVAVILVLTARRNFLRDPGA